ncbi:DUF2057 family protein [Chimaeribacter arupi]|uniref:UPF0319 protein JK232_13005 n=1 Tax=Nissabacter archeti TaxID=1917880 RepID=A0ABS5JIL5_9GAMM|nr:MULTISPECIES: DUF2057 family protein [Yersiniaceae]MBS0969815.1 DUF2057 family protein [Nissabacter archeti]MDV5141253.1 DUF2057 family protein [Chimaeribacter arupi]PLR39870.1 hypothetical protein CYR23_00570 [Chimaeribacter arupi]WKZ91114.1 DUF2057 family protein [Chimaeribacter arupi]
MKRGWIVTGLLALSVCLPATAATLALSPDVDVLVVDGKKAAGSSLNQVEQLTLAPGRHQLLFRVSRVLRAGARDQYLYHSSPQIAAFDIPAEGAWQLTLPRLENDADGKRFDAHPDYQVVDGNQHPLPVRRDTLQIPGLSLGADLEKAIAEYNAANQPASVTALLPAAAASPALPATSGTVSQASVTVQGENVAEQMLQYWFQQADAPTRQRFLNWAEKHPAR